jgi:thiosulfate dehydrogenase
MSRSGWFVVGVIVGVVVVVPLGAYLFAKFGGIAMATTAKPLPFEETFAKTALHASEGGAAKVQDSLPPSEANLLAGAHVFVDNCAVCHGLPGQSKTRIASGEFPPPPQLFQTNEMVTDDPEGVTHWKVAHGIRLSGMPGFGSSLSDAGQWQVTMLLKNAAKLPPAVEAVLAKGGCETSEQQTAANRQAVRCYVLNPPYATALDHSNKIVNIGAGLGGGMTAGSSPLTFNRLSCAVNACKDLKFQ